MGGGLLAGLSNEDAARYAFLLATPIIGAAALLKLPELLGTGRRRARPGARRRALRGATTYLAVKFLLRFFETNRLTPFGIYCIVAGVTCTLICRVRRVRHTRIADADPGRRGRAEDGRPDPPRAADEGHAVDMGRDRRRCSLDGGPADYDAVVLDVMLPGIDGFEICRRLRGDGVWAPVLMLTARDAVEDRVAGLDAAPTTTWPSRSRSPSCWHACGRWSGAARPSARL